MASPSLTPSNSSLALPQRPSDLETSSVSSADSSQPRRALLPGIYVPTVAFFDPETEDLDLSTTASHAIRLAKAGIAGIATQGSNGEAVHMDRAERMLVTATTRKALDAAGYENLPVIVGCGAQSTRETIRLCQDAHTAGGDYALVLPPSYYKGLHVSSTVMDFFHAVADASPIPLLIYNFPPVAGGIDLTSDDIIALAAHPNIAGCKLTCGNTGKLNRVCAATKAATIWDSPPTSSTPQANAPFMVLGGSADFLLQTLVGGGAGMIGGYANIAPLQCVKMLELVRANRIAEARKLQAVIARGDWAAIQGGIVSTKAGLNAWYGYGGYARSPLPRPGKEETAKWKDAFEECVLVERTVEQELLVLSEKKSVKSG